jgi:hypothetical protein
VRFLCIFRFELFLDRGLDGALEMRLVGEESGTLSFEIAVNSFGEVRVESALFVCLELNGVERISQFAGSDGESLKMMLPRAC